MQEFIKQALEHIAEPTQPIPLVWSDLETYHCNQDNILHILATSENTAELLAILEQHLAVDSIRTLASTGNAISVTPFHYACKYLNTVLFDFIVKHLEHKALFEIASSTDTDIGRTSFHMLCEAAYANPVPTIGLDGWFLNVLPDAFKIEANEVLKSYQPVQLLPTDAHFALMSRFRKVFSNDEMDFLVMQQDFFQNTGLLLCCYPGDAKLLASCLQLISNREKLIEAVQATLREGTHLTPIRFLSALSSAECIQALVQCLGVEVSTKLFLEQNALQWCYGWSQSAELRYAVALAYGDILETAIITKGERRSLLCRSLHGDGVIQKRLMEKKHISSRYEILCEVFFSLYGPAAEAVASPRQSHGIFAPAALEPVPNGLGLHRELLAKITRMRWPEWLLKSVGEAVITEFKNPQKILEKCKPKLLNVITLYSEYALSIPLALMYKLQSEKLSKTMAIDLEKLSPEEKQYVKKFREDNNVIQNLQNLYASFAKEHEGDKLATIFLTRVHKSRSLLLLTILATFDFPDHLDRTVTERFVKVLERHLTSFEGFKLVAK